jgi:hypothetical protein
LGHDFDELLPNTFAVLLDLIESVQHIHELSRIQLCVGHR